MEEQRKRKHTEENEELNQKNEVEEEKQPAKKRGKKKKKENDEPPSISYDLEELFALGGKRAEGSHLHFPDMRTLIMLMVHGERFPNIPTWCRIQNWKKIRKTLVVQVGGLTQQDYADHKKYFKGLQKHFEMPVIPVRNEGNNTVIKSPVQSFLYYRMPKKLIAEKKQLKKDKENGLYTVADFLLSEERLRANDFPQWNSAAKEHGVITTRRNGEKEAATNESEIYAIDCEMCQVSGGEKALTRISVVNNEMETIYDTYVKPEEEITDYVTQYSGVTAEIMKDVKTRLKDVHNQLLKIIKPNSILVGHSLDFDLRALKVHHDHVIDTSEIYQDQRGPRFKSSLKFLVKSYLKRDIQSSNAGHCSIEDAKACMELVQLKMNKGLGFGDPQLDVESIYEAVSRAGKKGALLDTDTIVRQHLCCQRRVVCNNDQQVLEGIKDVIHDVDFAFAHLKDYENGLRSTEGFSKEAKKKAMKETDSYLGNILDELPPQTLVLVSLSSGYVAPDIVELIKQKEERKTDIVKAAIRTARNGVCFVKIT